MKFYAFARGSSGTRRHFVPMGGYGAYPLSEPKGEKGIMSFGKLLTQLRNEKGVSIKELGPSIGVNYTYISKLESSKSTPSLELIQRIADYFNCDADLLMIAAGKIPPKAMKVVTENPEEVLAYLRSKIQHESCLSD